MSAMGELRILLLENGVDWNEYGDGYTCWTHDGVNYTAQQNILGRLIVSNLTPDQAIRAICGLGECEIEERRDGWGVTTRHCGNCGADLDCDTRNRQNYCPNCGLRLVKR